MVFKGYSCLGSVITCICGALRDSSGNTDLTVHVRVHCLCNKVYFWLLCDLLCHTSISKARVTSLMKMRCFIHVFSFFHFLFIASGLKTFHTQRHVQTNTDELKKMTMRPEKDSAYIQKETETVW